MPTKKLIEVALPLEAINKQSVRENYIYRGNPSAIHKWWSGKPLAACRAVLFAQLADDPSSHPELFPNEETQQQERQRLFDIIEQLIVWENSNDERILSTARAEILKSTGSAPPPIYDPFAGGGSIPLEAQRLGLEAHASDLNLVAVLINKALIEIPPRFASRPPINPISRNRIGADWKGTAGLAADVRYYGQWMHDEAERRIGHLYPKVKLPKEYGSGEANVIAWLWVRTVKCPNPACGIEMPLTTKWWVSTKAGNKKWVEPIIDRQKNLISFEVRDGEGTPRNGTFSRRGAICIACDAPVKLEYIRGEGKDKKLHERLIAIVAEHNGKRLYLSPNQQHEEIAKSATPSWIPDVVLDGNPRHITPPVYGMDKFADIFTSRQLTAMSVLVDLVREVKGQIMQDFIQARMPSIIGNDNNHEYISAYSDAIATYLAFATDKHAMYGCSLVPWYTKEDRPQWVFTRQAISMVWDFAELNPLADIGGSFAKSVSIVADAVEPIVSTKVGYSYQADACSGVFIENAVICTDPPY